jgi:hypothetical protein
MAVGAALPFVLSMTPAAFQITGGIDAVEQRAHLAHFLENDAPPSVRVPKGQGPQAAASVHHILTTSADPYSKGARDIAQKLLVDVGGFRGKAGELKPTTWSAEGLDKAYPSRAAAEDVLSKKFQAAGAGQERAAGLARNAVKKTEGTYPSTRAHPSGRAVQSVLEEAERSFRAAGKKAPSKFRAAAGVMGRGAKAALPVTAIFASIGGFAGVSGHRKKVKKLRELRDMQKGAQEQPTLTDRVFQAAPGIGALGGAAWGATSPQAFDPTSLFKSIKSPSSAKGRAVSGLLGAGLGATSLWLPSALRDAAKAVVQPTPPMKDVRSAPLIIQKQAAASGQVLVQHMFSELEAITESLALQ